MKYHWACFARIINQSNQGLLAVHPPFSLVRDEDGNWPSLFLRNPLSREKKDKRFHGRQLHLMSIFGNLHLMQKR